MTEKRFVDYFDKDHNYIIQDLQNEDEYQIGFVNCDEDVFLKLVNKIAEENEQLKTENTMLKEHQNINCQNCQYFVSDSVSSDCLKREDIGYKGTCIDGMDLHMLAKNCPYYQVGKMTEKRFTLSERDLNEINNTNAIVDNGIPCTQRYIVKLLNELHDENEELKKRNEYLKKRCDEYWEEAGLNSDYYD